MAGARTVGLEIPLRAHEKGFSSPAHPALGEKPIVVRRLDAHGARRVRPLMRSSLSAPPRIINASRRLVGVSTWPREHPILGHAASWLLGVVGPFPLPVWMSRMIERHPSRDSDVGQIIAHARAARQREYSGYQGYAGRRQRFRALPAPRQGTRRNPPAQHPARPPMVCEPLPV